MVRELREVRSGRFGAGWLTGGAEVEAANLGRRQLGDKLQGGL